MRLNQITLPAVDLLATRDFYLKLGFILIVDSADYARLQAPEGGTTLSLSHVKTTPEGPCPKIYLELDSANALDQMVEALKSKGTSFISSPKDQSWLWREAWLYDPSGNKICLYFAGKNRLDPPWRVKP